MAFVVGCGVAKVFAGTGDRVCGKNHEHGLHRGDNLHVVDRVGTMWRGRQCEQVCARLGAAYDGVLLSSVACANQSDAWCRRRTTRRSGRRRWARTSPPTRARPASTSPASTCGAPPPDCSLFKFWGMLDLACVGNAPAPASACPPELAPSYPVHAWHRYGRRGALCMPAGEHP